MLTRLILPGCFLFFCLNVDAQNNAQSVKFLREAFSVNPPSFYYNQLYGATFQKIKEGLSIDTIKNNYSFKRQSKSDELILTIAEKQFIQRKMDEQINFKWGEGLFKGAKMIVRDEANPKQNLESIIRLHKSVYSFSKPVFIRNNSICVFYYQYICGGECGQGSINVYRKVNNEWKEWIVIVQWIS